MSFETIILRIGLAIIISGLIGLEREISYRPAGFRTNMLVCIGSTVIMIIGISMSNECVDTENVDPSRLSAQVISGIGFLGAGTIIKDGVTVKGLTTAATLWAMACIGLAIGAGYYFLGIVTGILIIVILTLFNYLEKITIKKQVKNIQADIYTYNIGILNEKLDEFVKNNNCKIGKMSISTQNDNNFENVKCRFEIQFTKKSKIITMIDIYSVFAEVEHTRLVTLKHLR